MDSVGLHLIEWPFYPLYVFSYILIRPVCQQKKLHRVDFFSTWPAWKFDTVLNLRKNFNKGVGINDTLRRVLLHRVILAPPWKFFTVLTENTLANCKGERFLFGVLKITH